jgi:hypothetical protein
MRCGLLDFTPLSRAQGLLKALVSGHETSFNASISKLAIRLMSIALQFGNLATKETYGNRTQQFFE